MGSSVVASACIFGQLLTWQQTPPVWISLFGLTHGRVSLLLIPQPPTTPIPDKCPCYTNVRVWSSAKAETVYHHKPCALGSL